MTEFENLKRNYALTIQFGLASNTGYYETKHGNDILPKFCEQLVENSDYHDQEKARMKHELGLLKEVLSKEIECHYKKGF